MKLALALVLSVMLSPFVACKKSDSDSKPADPSAPPSASVTPNGSGNPTERREKVLKDLDTDGDGKISDEERAAGRKKRVERMRAKLDTNGDGKLTPDELKASTGRMKFDDPAALDTNKDGDISVDELEAGMQARRDLHRGSGSGSSTGSADQPPPE
jgi:hypothetical protein